MSDNGGREKTLLDLKHNGKTNVPIAAPATRF